MSLPAAVVYGPAAIRESYEMLSKQLAAAEAVEMRADGALRQAAEEVRHRERRVKEIETIRAQTERGLAAAEGTPAVDRFRAQLEAAEVELKARRERLDHVAKFRDERQAEYDAAFAKAAALRNRLKAIAEAAL